MTTDLQPLSYGPTFDFADVRERFASPSYLTVWLDNIIEPDEECVTEYEFVFIVYARALEQPVLCVSSEKNACYSPDSGQDNSHYFCVFDARAHSNFGASNTWADPEAFRAAALALIEERTGEPMSPEPEEGEADAD